MNVYQKLNAARKEFHSKKLTKTGENKYANYQYFELGDFIPQALEVFEQIGIVGMVSYGKEQATLEIVNCDKPEEKVLFCSPMSTCEMKGLHEVQRLGAVQSYLRRYLWVAALEIVEHDALDATTGKETKVPRQPAMEGIGDDLTPESKEALKDLAAQATELVEQGNAAQALAVIKAFGLQGDENIYLDRQFSSQVKTAIRKAAKP